MKPRTTGSRSRSRKGTQRVATPTRKSRRLQGKPAENLGSPPQAAPVAAATRQSRRVARSKSDMFLENNKTQTSRSRTPARKGRSKSRGKTAKQTNPTLGTAQTERVAKKTETKTQQPRTRTRSPVNKQPLQKRVPSPVITDAPPPPSKPTVVVTPSESPAVRQNFNFAPVTVLPVVAEAKAGHSFQNMSRMAQLALFFFILLTAFHIIVFLRIGGFFSVEQLPNWLQWTNNGFTPIGTLLVAFVLYSSSQCTMAACLQGVNCGNGANMGEIERSERASLTLGMVHSLAMFANLAQCGMTNTQCQTSIAYLAFGFYVSQCSVNLRLDMDVFRHIITLAFVFCLWYSDQQLDVIAILAVKPVLSAIHGYYHKQIGNSGWLMREFALAMLIINVSAFIDLNQSWNFIISLLIYSKHKFKI